MTMFKQFMNWILSRLFAVEGCPTMTIRTYGNVKNLYSKPDYEVTYVFPNGLPFTSPIVYWQTEKVDLDNDKTRSELEMSRGIYPDQKPHGPIR